MPLALRVTFNTPLEMQKRRRRRLRRDWLGHFQYSIGDAQLLVVATYRSVGAFQYSIGDAPTMKCGSTALYVHDAFNTPLEMHDTCCIS